MSKVIKIAVYTFIGVLLLSGFVLSVLQAEAADDSVDVWWPANNASIDGTQTFKGMLSGKALNEYYFFWQVDGGGYVLMGDSQKDYPHKEAVVDVSGWNWKTDGTYNLNFIAQDLQGKEIARKSVTIYRNKPASSAVAVLTAPVSAPVTSVVNKAFSLSKLYANASSPALKQALAWKASRPADADIMEKVGAQNSSVWLGGWNSDVQGDVKKVMGAAAVQGAIPTFVAYNIPHRDCGSYSAGGVSSKEAYLSWIKKISDGIGGGEAIVILEPDALSNIDCLSDAGKADRYSMLSSALDIFKNNAKAHVYVDAGHSGWIADGEMARRLAQAGISKAAGFSLNVSNFIPTSENAAYGEKISKASGNAHFVIDTSRNGSGSNGEWCNPSGRSLGQKPTLSTGNSLIDAYLWIKTPGESDGTCNGGPSAGSWWPEYALDLAKRAGY